MVRCNKNDRCVQKIYVALLHYTMIEAVMSRQRAETEWSVLGGRARSREQRQGQSKEESE